jgi:pimeloyl-ACP methyl ester carboxylesterase
MTPAYREIYWRSQDDLRLYARIYESKLHDARTVLCLHGLMRNSRDFEDLAPHLQPRYRVVVPDLRGRGSSAWDPDQQNYQPAVYLKDIGGLLAAIETEQVDIVGTSLGGILGMMLGAGHRRCVRSLVLNDIGPEIDPAGIARIKGYAGRLPPVRAWDAAITQTKTMFGEAWPDLPPARWSQLARRGYSQDSGGTVSVAADPRIGDALRAAPGPSTGDLWPLWPALRGLPILGIRGARSDILSVATFARMQAENPAMRALTVANRGHVPLLDEPECVAAIDAFLADLPGR